MTELGGSDVDRLALATRCLREAYGGRLAVGGLDLSVPRGVVYGFFGPNGAGKTTTMRMLTGLIRPDAGEISILGKPFNRGDREHLYALGDGANGHHEMTASGGETACLFRIRVQGRVGGAG